MGTNKERKQAGEKLRMKAERGQTKRENRVVTNLESEKGWVQTKRENRVGQ
jgi:hypothetical protein